MTKEQMEQSFKSAQNNHSPVTFDRIESLYQLFKARYKAETTFSAPSNKK